SAQSGGGGGHFDAAQYQGVGAGDLPYVVLSAEYYPRCRLGHALVVDLKPAVRAGQCAAQAHWPAYGWLAERPALVEAVADLDRAVELWDQPGDLPGRAAGCSAATL